VLPGKLSVQLWCIDLLSNFAYESVAQIQQKKSLIGTLLPIVPET
jgi:hypothetical protein